VLRTVPKTATRAKGVVVAAVSTTADPRETSGSSRTREKGRALSTAPHMTAATAAPPVSAHALTVEETAAILRISRSLPTSWSPAMSSSPFGWAGGS